MIKTIAKVAEILRLFTVDKPVLYCNQISARLNMNPSTVSRLLKTLEMTGFLAKAPEERGYRLGPLAMSLAQLALDPLDLTTISRPYLRRLLNATQETVGLHVRRGMSRVCIFQLESPQQLKWVTGVGEELPLYAGSSGKLLSAFLPPEELTALLNSMKPLTARTIRRHDEFVNELTRVRQNGYAMSEGERKEGVSGVAVPIFNVRRELVAALTCSGPSSRWNRNAMAQKLPVILETSRDISQALGYRAPGTTWGGHAL